MVDVTVWDERDDFSACTWRSTLMVLVASGFRNFPLGAYTVAEAQAFRAGDSRLNFSGPVEHALSRYGVQVVSPTPYSQAELAAALATPGKAYAVAGRTANFGAGHELRRWDPVFSGFHAVCVIPIGGGQVLWLDPLAYTGYIGDVVQVSDVVDVFAAGNYPNDARYLPLAVKDDMDLKGTPVRPLQNKKVTLKAGGTFVADPTAATYEVITSYQTGQLFVPVYEVTGNSILGTDRWYGGFEPFQRAGAPIAFGYLSVALCNPEEPIETVTVEVPAPAPEPLPPATGVDVVGALADLNLLTIDLNNISRASTQVSANRSLAVKHKNAAKLKLGG